MTCSPAPTSTGTGSRNADWVGNWRSGLVAWGLPIAALVLGGFLEPPAKPLIWAVSLSFMGTACLINAARCGRVHCYFTGPFFLLMAVATLLHGFSIVPLGANGWSDLAITIAVGGCALCWLPEAIWGKFTRRHLRSAEPKPAIRKV